MKRDRESARGLLPLMEARPWMDGKTVTYRYHPTGQKPINLGTNRIDAIRKVLDLLGNNKDHGTLKWIWERYTDVEAPAPRWKKLVDSTKTDYQQAWKEIEKTFGKMPANQIESTMVARYVHIERAKAPKRANTEKALLSNLFGHGIKLGVCTINATIGVEPHQLEARTEAPDEALLIKYLGWLAQQTSQRQIIGMAAEYASLAGNRKCEFLHLTWPQIDRQAGVIRTIRAKQRGSKREQVVEVVKISTALDALLVRLLAIRKLDCLYVFPTRDNNQYSDRGFKTLWQRCTLEAIKQNVLSKKTRFTFHDLRAFYATKHKKVTGILPDLHKNPETTARVYDRNTEVFRSSN
ncbi:integrase [Acidovorax carolinensis]|nr:integrase [Acidovorax carolinensis]